MVQLAMSFPINHEYKFETLKADLINLEKKTLKSVFFLGKREAIYKTKTWNSDFCVFCCKCVQISHLRTLVFGGQIRRSFQRNVHSTDFQHSDLEKGRADGPTVAEAKGGIQVESHNDLIVGIFGGFFGMWYPGLLHEREFWNFPVCL